MAKTVSEKPATANTVNNEVSSPVINATPDNTPLPGGGSWSWDYTGAQWVENTAYSPPTPPTPLVVLETPPCV